MVDFKKVNERIMSENALEKFNPGALASIIGAENVAAINDDFSGGIQSSNFLPQISIKGREFRLKIDGEETRLPDKSLNVFLISSRTSVSKTFYKGAWGGADSAGKPDCSSADGVVPDDNVDEPQNSNCQLCPNNAWGSKITATSNKGKACSDYKLLVVSLQAAPDTPFALRVPAASLKPFSAYIAKLKMAGVPANAAVTKLSFSDAEYPQLEFDFVDTVKSKDDYLVLTELAESSDVLEAVHIKPRAAIAPAPAVAEVAAVPSVQPVVAEVVEHVPIEVVVEPPVVEEAPTAEPTLAEILAKNKTTAKPRAKKAKPELVVEAAPAAETAPAVEAAPVTAAVPAPAESQEIKGLDQLLAKMKDRK